MDLHQDSTYFRELQTNTGWGRMLESFARWCAPQPGQRVLDVGCGPGQLPAIFARGGAYAAGVDNDAQMFKKPLHKLLLCADAVGLPFPNDTFDMVTASNVLFLASQPKHLLREMARVCREGGEVCLLNPSEHMSLAAATRLAEQRDLQGLARQTLLNYAGRAENNFRWDEKMIGELFQAAGLRLTGTDVRMGPGLVRFARAGKSGD